MISRTESNQKWVVFEPPEKMGDARLKDVAQMCGWEYRRQRGIVHICLSERYQRRSLNLASLSAVLNADGSQGAGWTELPSRAGLTAGISQAEIEREVRQRLSEATPGSFWFAWRLLIMAAPDDVMRINLPKLHERVAVQSTGASLWLASVDQLALTRTSFTRLFFAAQHAPELLERPPAEFEGVVSARGLGSGPAIISMDTLYGLYCSWQAPWVIGMTAPRFPAVLITLANSPWDGLVHPPPSLLDTLSAQVLAVPSKSAYGRPEIDGPTALAGLRWWASACGELLGTLLDPANFRDKYGVYDPTLHFSTILSVDRLVGCVAEAISAYRRREYARKLMLFEALEILEGLGLGSYEQTCDADKLDREIEQLRSALPPEAANLLLPRCERAVLALRDIGKGFLPERRVNGRIKVVRDPGSHEEMAERKAVSSYLRAVRNATHSYREVIKKPRSLSLLAGHNGEIDGAVADVAALHLLRILANPQRTLFGRQQDR